MAGTSFKVINPLVNLDKLDLLIDIYLTDLIDRSEDVKLCDFVRLVDLRHRIDPVSSEKADPMQQVNSARERLLPMNGVTENEGDPNL